MTTVFNDQVTTSIQINNLIRKAISENIEVLKLNDIYKLMDDVWDELGCDNRNIDLKKIQEFYNHPIWILNGLFIEQDKHSLENRHTIVRWINSHNQNIQTVVDYGGGFGTLARLIAESNNHINIDIYEPHPSHIAVEKTKHLANIRFINSISKKYDCLVSTDVIEHVTEPLNLLADMINIVEENGYLIIAHCFVPVIKCHLPTTFHLRYTFGLFAKLFGLKHLGYCKKRRITVYQKVNSKPFNWRAISIFEKISKIMYPLIRCIHIIYEFVLMT